MRGGWCFLLVQSCLLASCTPSPDALIDQLGVPGRDVEFTKQEILLAGQRAVTPVLRALEAPHPAPADVADVLVRLSLRLDDPRLDAAIGRHLLGHPDPGVRERLAHGLASRHRLTLAEALVGALSDTVAPVRLAALIAISNHEVDLEPRWRDAAMAVTPALSKDSDPRIREEATILVDRLIQPWLRETRQASLAADVERADSLLAVALAFAPENYRAAFQQGMLWLSHGRSAAAISHLRDHGMLVDAPHLDTSPTVDGRLDDAVWEQAARLGPFYVLSLDHTAALRAENETQVRVLYTDDAVFLGVDCMDAEPGDFITLSYQADGSKLDWSEDFVEIFIDADFDRSDYFHASINSAGRPVGLQRRTHVPKHILQ